MCLIPRPSHHPVLDACSMRNREERPGYFLSHESRCVYLGGQRGEGFPIERTSLRPFFVVSVPSARVSLLVQSKELVCEMYSFDGGPLPPLSTLEVDKALSAPCKKQNIDVNETSPEAIVAFFSLHSLIGASLSEPHTNVTALRTCVCMYVCMSVCLFTAIYRKF